MNDVVFFVLITIGVIIALITGALTVYLNEKKFREDLINYYEDVIEKQDDTIKQNRQEIEHLKTKIDFYERNKEC